MIGIDLEGKSIEPVESYAPLFHRIEIGIPTTNNYAESFHQKINTKIADMRHTISCRVSLVARKIMKRFDNIKKSSWTNLRDYVNGLKSTVKEKIEKHPENRKYFEKKNCNCSKAQYYSMLYNMEVPCMHTILNGKWYRTDQLKKDIISESENFILDHVRTMPFDYFELPPFDEKSELKNEEEEEEEEEVLDSPVNVNVVNEIKSFDEPITKMVYHIYSQLKSFVNIDKCEVCSALIKMQQEMLMDEKYLAMLQDAYDEFLAELQVKTLTLIYELKGLSLNI